MSLVIPSPNMSLPIPIVGVEIGPDYATDVNNSLTLVDQHDHSPGRGTQVTPAGLNINTDLDFKNNNALNLIGVTLSAGTTASALLQSLSVAPGTESPTPLQDLWYTDSAGNQIQITAGGSLAAAAAAIPGESYAFGTFYWKQGAGSTTPANFDIGSITLRPNVAATTVGVTISPNAAATGSTNFILPLLPTAGPTTSPAFLVIDNSGNTTTAIPTALGINTANIADNAITTVKILDGNVTHAKLAAGAVLQNTQTFNATANFTVPAGVTTLQAYLVGGGGGGGSGGRGSGGGIANSGGGGGGGSIPILFQFAVTPGDTVHLVIGAGGAGGTAAASTNGNPGIVGGNTTLTLNSTLLYTIRGGNPGAAGLTGNSAGGAGAVADFTRPNTGGGGGGGIGVNGTTGGNSIYAAAGSGGTQTGGSTAGGGGGGGGAGLGAGGNGGNGGSNTAQGGIGIAAAANTGGGGGASGGNGNASGAVGAVGGAGGSGKAILYWIS